MVSVQVGRKCLADYVLMVAENAAQRRILHVVLPLLMEVGWIVRVAATLAAIPLLNTAGFALKENHSAMRLVYILKLISYRLKTVCK